MLVPKSKVSCPEELGFSPLFLFSQGSENSTFRLRNGLNSCQGVVNKGGSKGVQTALNKATIWLAGCGGHNRAAGCSVMEGTTGQNAPRWWRAQLGSTLLSSPCMGQPAAWPVVPCRNCPCWAVSGTKMGAGLGPVQV